uniref:Uncharacterized protein n=1 Tax=Anguilla anguilla TaxID=7936 RepID=A0A0E9QBN6_ANGAN
MGLKKILYHSPEALSCMLC